MSVTGPLTNILVTVMVALLAVVLPVVDRAVCRRLEVFPGRIGGKNAEKRALLFLRECILLILLFVYLLVVAYLVFFSRVAGNDYRIHVALMADLRQSIHVDNGIFGLLRTVEELGVKEGLRTVRIGSYADIAQVYLNVMLFVPLGYLLPYCFRFFRVRPVLRPFLAGIALSFLVENLQLITKRGFYDVDDLLANSVGALLGACLFRIFAFTVTHPDWKQELQDQRRWNRYTRRHTWYPFGKKSYLVRTTLFFRSEQQVRDFFSIKLGMRPLGELDREDGRLSFLFQMGNMQLEAVCLGEDAQVMPQQLSLAVEDFERVYKRLSRHGVDVSLMEQDAYSFLRSFSFEGPDGLTVTILG